MKRTRMDYGGGYLFSVVMGGVGAVLLFALLLLAALIGESRRERMRAPFLSGGV